MIIIIIIIIIIILLIGVFNESIEGQRVSTKKKKVPDFIEGRPLPNTGTCLHYKKSHRWLR